MQMQHNQGADKAESRQQGLATGRDVEEEERWEPCWWVPWVPRSVRQPGVRSQLPA